MSIERNQSSSSDNAAREVERVRDRPQDKVREQPKEALVDRFRTLMQNRGDAGEQRLDPRMQDSHAAELAQAGEQAGDARSDTVTHHAVLRKGHDDASGQQGGDTLQPAELAALYQAQLMAREIPAVVAPPVAPQAAQANPQALADLLERHVRQLAVSAGGTQADDAQVLLRLSDSTLPGTDLLLSRTQDGWLLRADVSSRSSYEAIQQAAPQLAERFAARQLGTLQIEPHFHG